MRYKTLDACVQDLEKHNQLIRIRHQIDPDLEMAEIHRQVYNRKGPAIFYENIKGSPFPAVSNLFGTYERSCFIFRSTLKKVSRLMAAKASPGTLLKSPLSHLSIPGSLISALPTKTTFKTSGFREISLDQLPMIKSWPEDGGPFILLPQVFSEDPLKPGIFNSNLGMYRVQLAGNDYLPGQEIGLHYQIRRDIGIHHTNAIKKGEPLKVSIFIGGPPAHTFSAVMPLPEGVPEVCFAGVLAGRRFRYIRHNGYVLSADADFCITGTIEPDILKDEGPFGDHLGYYSLKHPFPVLKIASVYCKDNSVWPFTVVGRPPQEDTAFGKLIHEMTKPMLPVSIPGVESLNAVDAAGVHPLLLATAKERYVPYEAGRPMELLTLANAILGFGHCSLAKYLIIADAGGNPPPDVDAIDTFFTHILERIDFSRDLHFQTQTTMDTLDYSGKGLNQGSKVIIAAAGPPKRTLGSRVPESITFPAGFTSPKPVLPGIIAVSAPAWSDDGTATGDIETLSQSLDGQHWPDELPLIILTEDSTFVSKSLNNFLWVTFTRSDPASDIHGGGSFVHQKHWGCKGPLIIDARLKPHHAPPLKEDPSVSASVTDLLNQYNL